MPGQEVGARGVPGFWCLPSLTGGTQPAILSHSVWTTWDAWSLLRAWVREMTQPHNSRIPLGHEDHSRRLDATWANAQARDCLTDRPPGSYAARESGARRTTGRSGTLHGQPGRRTPSIG
jgi:hypothetical protein